jgi:hypothetical protein
MDHYLTIEHWASIVRKMKDSERGFDIPAYETECLARDILRTIRTTRFRQGVLFKDHRGEEYELFIERLSRVYDPNAVQRAVKDEEFWDVSFSLRVL